jgi:hypothetical protein
MSRRARIILDDARRKDETEIMERWENEFEVISSEFLQKPSDLWNSKKVHI